MNTSVFPGSCLGDEGPSVVRLVHNIFWKSSILNAYMQTSAMDAAPTPSPFDLTSTANVTEGTVDKTDENSPVQVN
jgi:hypothetical protein